MVEAAGLQIGAAGRNFGQRGLGQDIGGDILDRAIGDLVNEADVVGFARCHVRDHLAAGDLGIDDGLASAPAAVDHRDEILHWAIFLKIRNKSSRKLRKSEF
jgi:hypothetical protein